MSAWETIVAANIRVQLKRDRHLADCEAAKAEPDATLACAECGRAQWMHETRHDTCGQFCWVTVNTITDKQIGQLATADDLPAHVRKACYDALNDFARGDGYVRDAKRTCASAINSAKRKTRKRAVANPAICQVEHPNWDGPMICGNTAPCSAHGCRPAEEVRPALHHFQHELATERNALAVEKPLCQVEHPNWDGPMICGNPMPCTKHK